MCRLQKGEHYCVFCKKLIHTYNSVIYCRLGKELNDACAPCPPPPKDAKVTTTYGACRDCYEADEHKYV